MKTKKYLITLEDYIYFLDNPEQHELTIDQLNQIVQIHGFRKLHRTQKKVIMGALKSIEKLMTPFRSTMKENISSSSAFASLTNDEVIEDLDALKWQEYCSLKSIETITISPHNNNNKTKKTKKTKNKKKKNPLNKGRDEEEKEEEKEDHHHRRRRSSSDRSGKWGAKRKRNSITNNIIKRNSSTPTTSPIVPLLLPTPPPTDEYDVAAAAATDDVPSSSWLSLSL